MAAQRESLDSARYGAESGCAYLSGIQAIARLPLDQSRLDAAAGLNTAGFVSGYRGSPLGGLDQELWRLAVRLQAGRIVFQPAINEDLAATAVWGSQQVGLFPGARYQGVFGLWYGKAPGLDRSCDALRHANAAGSSPAGGALLVVGDDPACKSSTLPSGSEYALRDLGIPVLAPADVQEVLDFGLFGWALSRFAGCWAGLVAVTDVADSAGVVQVDLARHGFRTPPQAAAPHIRLADTPLAQEARLALKAELAETLAAANGIDRIVAEASKPQLVVVAAGKPYHDVREALAHLGLGTSAALRAAGVRLAKVGMTWPLGAAFATQACRDARRVLVVENKRPFVEQQLRLLLRDASVVLGKQGREPLLPVAGELDVPTIAAALAAALPEGPPDRSYLQAMAADEASLAGTEDMKTARKPLFCAGCPHNASTRLPAGSRAGAGIGCHYMAQWMDRNTAAVTHMGAEGANWIGQAPFTSERHLFVNLGDGTFFHSGILAIRAAVAAGVNITYKVLANDAVAMTGGQPVDGSLDVADIVAQVQAEGVAAVRVVCDDPRRLRRSPLPRSVPVHGRERLDQVQRELRELPGCTVLVYDQTCAAELRRRRKRGQAPDPDVRVAINDAVCEGCGDCSRQSNCVAVAPLPTALGEKRTIDQSACNKDLSCLAGLCPALVTLRGAKPKRTATTALRKHLADRVPPPVPSAATANILIAGVGGTGIVTVAQVLATAAHLDGKPAYALDMTGLAQKGGAVLSHIRIGDGPATRIPARGAELLIGADPIAAASREALAAIAPWRTDAVLATNVAPTAEFVLNQPPADAAAAQRRLRHRVRELRTVAAGTLATRLFGTNAAANILLLGYAWQLGTVPVSLPSLRRAIALNGVAVVDNLTAFECGRAAAWDLALLPKAVRSPAPIAMQPPPSEDTFEARVAARSAHLVAYQDAALASRYQRLVRRLHVAEQAVAPGSSLLAEAAAEGYFRLLAVKDEYEVARLFTMPAGGGARSDDGKSLFLARLGREFAPGFAVTFHFGRDVLPWRTGNRRGKVAVGAWVLPLLRLLAKGRRWRGSWLDPFRLRPDSRRAQALRTLFEQDYAWLASHLSRGNLATAAALARLPASIKGFGAVREAAADAALAVRERLRAQLRAPINGTGAIRPAIVRRAPAIIAADAPARREPVAS